LTYFFIAFGILIVAFLWWRFTSVARGARQRDQRLLAVVDPIAERLEKKETVAADEIADLSRQPQFRPMLYQMLRVFERLELFPIQDLSIQAQGEAALAYWMMHPNELQDAPSEIVLVEEIERDLTDGKGKFLIFRFRMPSGHWAEKDGWLLGLAGPFFKGDPPYSGVASGFARCTDKFGEVKPSELVDRYVGR
jgi:hypothetical protein